MAIGMHGKVVFVWIWDGMGQKFASVTLKTFVSRSVARLEDLEYPYCLFAFVCVWFGNAVVTYLSTFDHFNSICSSVCACLFYELLMCTLRGFG